MKETGPCCAFPPIGPHLLRIIFRSGYSESSHSRTVRSRFHRGSVGLEPDADTFKRLALGLQICLGVVVGGVEADMPKPTSDHGDVDACAELNNSQGCHVQK